MAMMPDTKVDMAEKARSAWPIPPCWMGLGLLTPDFVRLRPALPASDLVVELLGIARAAQVWRCGVRRMPRKERWAREAGADWPRTTAWQLSAWGVMRDA